MQRFQDLLSYVTMSEEEESETSKQRLKGQKRAFDLVNAERMVYEESGGGSSSTEPLQTDQDVIFKKMTNMLVSMMSCMKATKNVFCLIGRAGLGKKTLVWLL